MKFHMPTAVFFGPGTISLIGNIVSEELKASRPFLVTDGGIREAGILDRVLSQLPQIPVFDEVEQNPRHTTVNAGGEFVRTFMPDLIIGLGGGSALDAAKAIALLGTNPGNIENYEGRAKYKSPPLRVLAVPTTCGTGSEVTWVSVVTHTERRFKMSIKGPLMFPAAAVVDPDMLVTLPLPLIAATGLDALTHAIEAYTVKPATSLTDVFAREALVHIFSSLEAAYEDIRNNKEARERLMLGSMLAGFAFGNSDVGAVHCLAESVGSLYDTPHGVANAVFLPLVMEYNLPAAAGRYAEIARTAGIEEEKDEAAAKKLIAKIKILSQSLNIPTLKDLGVKEGDYEEIALKSFQNNSNPSNPRELTVDDYRIVLEKAFS